VVFGDLHGFLQVQVQLNFTHLGVNRGWIMHAQCNYKQSVGLWKDLYYHRDERENNDNIEKNKKILYLEKARTI
jgi:hypothetical protein